MKTIGLDIGTTSISALLLDGETVVELATAPNPGGLPGNAWEDLQDPVAILACCISLLDGLVAKHGEIGGIGVTGQMHGILYMDTAGRPVSPLYTWRDGTAGQAASQGETFAARLSERSGFAVATGFGLATCYAHSQTRCLPKEAACVCTIPDFVALSLAGRETPLLHPSLAASLGLFDVAQNRFDPAGIRASGLIPSLLPPVQEQETCLGLWNGIPVSQALGDNQASFLGAVQPGQDILVNIGTGSQISVYLPEFRQVPALELRPYLGGAYLAVGSSLCGGYAYQLLRDFLSDVAETMGLEAPADLYFHMNRAAEAVSGDGIRVSPQFLGTRTDPARRGCIDGLSQSNFTMAHLCRGVLEGICRELQELLERSGLEEGNHPLVASGNGVRKNPLMRQLLEQVFGRPVHVPPVREEAACGAALFSRRMNGEGG